MSRHLDENNEELAGDGLRDGIDARRAQWARELPHLDTRGMAILGRARWITLAARPKIEAIFASYGLDTGEADVVFTLLRSGPPYRLRPTELYKSMMISSGGVTNRIVKLVKAGLIRQVASDGDGRSLPVELTEEGLTRAREAFEADMAVETLMLESLTWDEQAQLARLLRKLALSLGSAPSSE
ncbi:MarR family transcriptional regulator [Aminobacter aminovorans]|uniref:MarR family transcriptional regulator n=1 Tax=Aminobacter aminovorans TaxID=83263 RepID=UPI002859B654|nr:MarR family transcriptional regulator [Aminobacter aminovorans]MDR7223116.1 DNA-binding MarR family transcriptional regulator [Aminobacter aminovorans]